MTTPDSVLFSEELIAEVQASVPDPFLQLMSLVTVLGDPGFFILFLTVYYWAVNRQKGASLLAVGLTTAVVSSGLKEAFGIPRPPTALHLIEASHYGMPSGHAMSPLLIYGAALYTAESLTRLQKTLIGFVTILSVSVSRIFLGVHYPADTLGGWFFGAVLLALFTLYAKMETERSFIIAVAVSAPFFILFSDVENVLLGFGGIIAVVLGWWLRTEADPLDVSTAEGALAVVVGLVAVGVGWTVSSDLSGALVLVASFVISLFIIGYLDAVALIKNELAVRQE